MSENNFDTLSNKINFSILFDKVSELFSDITKYSKKKKVKKKK